MAYNASYKHGKKVPVYYERKKILKVISILQFFLHINYWGNNKNKSYTVLSQIIRDGLRFNPTYCMFGTFFEDRTHDQLFIINTFSFMLHQIRPKISCVAILCLKSNICIHIYRVSLVPAKVLSQSSDHVKKNFEVVSPIGYISNSHRQPNVQLKSNVNSTTQPIQIRLP